MSVGGVDQPGRKLVRPVGSDSPPRSDPPSRSDAPSSAPSEKRCLGWQGRRQDPADIARMTSCSLSSKRS